MKSNRVVVRVVPTELDAERTLPAERTAADVRQIAAIALVSESEFSLVVPERGGFDLELH